MYTSYFDIYLLLLITSVCQVLFQECVSIRYEGRILPHNKQANLNVHSKCQRHTWEGCDRLSVECTPPTLSSVYSSPSSLSGKLCSRSVYPSVKHLEFYHILSKLIPISYTRGIIGRAVVGCPSNAHLQLWCPSAPLHQLCLLNFDRGVCIQPFRGYKFLQHNQQANAHTKCQRHTWEGCGRLSVECTTPTLGSIYSYPSILSDKLCSMSVHRSVQHLEFYHILSRLTVTPRGIFGRAVVGSPSNAQFQLRCISAPLQHLCLLDLRTQGGCNWLSVECTPPTFGVHLLLSITSISTSC